MVNQSSLSSRRRQQVDETHSSSGLPTLFPTSSYGGGGVRRNDSPATEQQLIPFGNFFLFILSPTLRKSERRPPLLFPTTSSEFSVLPCFSRELVVLGSNSKAAAEHQRETLREHATVMEGSIDGLHGKMDTMLGSSTSSRGDDDAKRGK
nr:hypothetical protein Itr_chr12CG17970 [Ipomoea trifida]